MQLSARQTLSGRPDGAKLVPTMPPTGPFRPLGIMAFSSVLLGIRGVCELPADV